jgi:hypothetical protein
MTSPERGAEHRMIVRPYTMTHGRTRASADFDLISLVVAVQGPAADELWEPEHRMILELARRPVSVAEIAARINLPAGVVRVLLDDLRAGGALIVRTRTAASLTPNLTTLKAVADGLRAL